MTPKEKAKELTNLHWLVEWANTPGQKSWSTAKKHSLIAVDEIIKTKAKDCWAGVGEENDPRYWQEVKQEVEKL